MKCFYCGSNIKELYTCEVSIKKTKNDYRQLSVFVRHYCGDCLDQYVQSYIMKIMQTTSKVT